MKHLGQLYNTFSIVGFDPITGNLGVAVATKYIAVGSSVPFAKPDIGAIAVQAYANPVLGPQGMELLSQGMSPDKVIETLIEKDSGFEYRQLGIVDSKGRAKSYTGSKCEDWAGGLIGPNCSAQGNMLIGEKTVSAMIDWFVSHNGNLADRLIGSLIESERVGGDKRGRQSSALVVASPKNGLAIYNNNLIDLRVDSHPNPCQRLKELLNEYYDIQLKTNKNDFLPLTDEIIKDIQLALYRLGRYTDDFTGNYNKQTRISLWNFCVSENQKNRWSEENLIDPKLLDYLIKVSQS